MAPTCNTQIVLGNSVAEHPVIPFCVGFNVGVNTDNRLMSDVSLIKELVAPDAHQLSWADIERLVTNAISSGFAPLTERQHIIDNIVAPAYSSLTNG